MKDSTELSRTNVKKETSLKKLQNLDGYLQKDLFSMYADLIKSGASNDEVIRINKMIIDKWSNGALILIKDKAWRIVRNVPKGKWIKL